MASKHETASVTPEDEGSAPETAAGEDIPENLAALVGGNLRRLRTRRGHSLEALARLSGVSRAMVSQIELGRSVPTIGLLWRIAKALDVPFAALTRSDHGSGTAVLRADKAKILSSQDGAFTSRALFPFETERRVEFYELTLAPHAVEEADAHAPGTAENLVVVSGEVEIDAGGETFRLGKGDSIYFIADAPHRYRNVASERAVMFLVMTYVDRAA